MSIVWGFATDYQSMHLVNHNQRLYLRVETLDEKKWFCLSARADGPFVQTGMEEVLEEPFQEQS